MGGVAKAVKTVAKAAWSVTKNTTKAFFDPVSTTKSLINDPAKTITKLTGTDILFGLNKTPTAGDPNTGQTERSQTRAEDDSMTAADRQRMLTRQGMQGVNPTLLTGQDLQKTQLAKDEELGGKGK